MFNFDLELLSMESSSFIPEIVPVSIIDVERSPPMSMDLPMSDNCPHCGGNNMKVGDYVCWNFCYGCFKKYEDDEDFPF